MYDYNHSKNEKLANPSNQPAPGMTKVVIKEKFYQYITSLPRQQIFSGSSARYADIRQKGGPAMEWKVERLFAQNLPP